MAQYDLITVGGGIGGSALATVMARAGHKVLVLERSEAFEDQVRGEWIAPWGVVETKRLGLYDALIAAGGHHLDRHVTYDAVVSPDVAEEVALPLNMFVPGVPGPLCIGHPKHCQTLIEAAAAAGATVLRGVEVEIVSPGDDPSVTFVSGGVRQVAQARMLVGADGRASAVREACGIVLHADKPHHMFAGMLVDNVPGWDERTQAIGTEDEFNFLVFPQGEGRARVYGSFPIEARHRFSGPEGQKTFLEAFRARCSPRNAMIADGRPAGPLRSYFNHDSWTDLPFAEGAVLVGDAAGWNDPIIGLGLSITYRDVRIVSDLLLGSDDWGPGLLAPYGEERFERMRRLRFVAGLTSALDAEFGERAEARRADFFTRAQSDPSLRSHAFAIMGGPETAPPAIFTAAYRAKVLGADQPLGTEFTA